VRRDQSLPAKKGSPTQIRKSEDPMNRSKRAGNIAGISEKQKRGGKKKIKWQKQTEEELWS